MRIYTPTLLAFHLGKLSSFTETPADVNLAFVEIDQSHLVL
jgi:hypothetical protein